MKINHHIWRCHDYADGSLDPGATKGIQRRRGCDNSAAAIAIRPDVN
jgi:hypothetical protein